MLRGVIRILQHDSRGGEVCYQEWYDFACVGSSPTPRVDIDGFLARVSSLRSRCVHSQGQGQVEFRNLNAQIRGSTSAKKEGDYPIPDRLECVGVGVLDLQTESFHSGWSDMLRKGVER